jgi:hypothetical protein
MTTTPMLFGGLPARTLQEIAPVLGRCPKIVWVRLYGS